MARAPPPWLCWRAKLVRLCDTGRRIITHTHTLRKTDAIGPRAAGAAFAGHGRASVSVPGARAPPRLGVVSSCCCHNGEPHKMALLLCAGCTVRATVHASAPPEARVPILSAPQQLAGWACCCAAQRIRRWRSARISVHNCKRRHSKRFSAASGQRPAASGGTRGGDRRGRKSALRVQSHDNNNTKQQAGEQVAPVGWAFEEAKLDQIITTHPASFGPLSQTHSDSSGKSNVWPGRQVNKCRKKYQDTRAPPLVVPI